MRILKFIFGLAIVVALLRYVSGEERAPSPPPTPAKPSAAALELSPRQQTDPMDKFSISKHQWEKGGFNSVAIVHLTFRNDNDFPLSDAVVVCTFHGASGSEISRKQLTVYEWFPPKKVTTVKGLNFGFISSQTRGSGCTIEKVSCPVKTSLQQKC